jgi:hypothetical protein
MAMGDVSVEGHDDLLVARHERTFDRLEQRVREVESDVTFLKTEHKSVMSDLYGNGQPGIRDTLLTFKKEVETRDDERRQLLNVHQADVKYALDLHNRQQTLRLNILSLIIAIMMLFVAWLTFVTTRGSIQKGLLTLPQIGLYDLQQAQHIDLRATMP